MDRIMEIVDIINSYGRPLAILSLSLIALAYIAFPLAAQWIQEHRGLVGKVVGGIIALPAITTFVDLLMG